MTIFVISAVDRTGALHRYRYDNESSRLLLQHTRLPAVEVRAAEAQAADASEGDDATQRTTVTVDAHSLTAELASDLFATGCKIAVRLTNKHHDRGRVQSVVRAAFGMREPIGNGWLREPLTENRHVSYRASAIRDIRASKASNFGDVNARIVSFAQSILHAIPNALPERTMCVECPMLQICQGQSPLIDSHGIEKACETAYSEAVPLFASAVESLTGTVPIRIEGPQPLRRQALFTER